MELLWLLEFCLWLSVHQNYYKLNLYARIQRGGTAGPDPSPLNNHKNIGFLSNTSPDTLKNTKLPSQEMLGHHWPARETPFKWLSLAGWWWPAVNAIWILSSILHSSKNKTKNHCQSWTTSGETSWIPAWYLLTKMEFSPKPFNGMFHQISQEWLSWSPFEVVRRFLFRAEFLQQKKKVKTFLDKHFLMD